MRLSLASPYPVASYKVIHIPYPFLYPFYPLLCRKSSPLKSLANARCKPLSARLPLRSRLAAATTLLRSTFDQPFGLTNSNKTS
jgi:hypothetical protein